MRWDKVGLFIGMAGVSMSLVAVAHSQAPAISDTELNQIHKKFSTDPSAPHDRDAPLIVLDPGHGGSNRGAPGVQPGQHEKQLTLIYARDLAERLRARGVNVLLTRTRDIGLTNRARSSLATQNNADAFISIHFNASPDRDQRGYESYTLSPQALAVDARALRHNDQLLPSDRAQHIAQDVARGLAATRSLTLASALQAGLRRVLRPEHDRGVKQASMHMLLSSTVPAALLEIGFADHAWEGRELRDPRRRAQICDSLAESIASWIKTNPRQS